MRATVRRAVARWGRRTETRSNGVYTAAWENILLQTAEGSTAASAASTAALAAASGLYARSLAAAQVRPDTGAARAVTPGVLFDIGRDLTETGESVHLIRVDGSRVWLGRAAAWDITGGPDPATWRYSVTMEGPTRSETVTTAAAGVLHLRLGSEARRPWRGRSPVPSETDKLAGGVERQLAGEASGAAARLFPVPHTGTEEEAAGKLAQDIRAARGGLVLHELAGFAGRGTGLNDFGPLAVRGGFQKLDQSRLGADPPAALVDLRRDVFRAVLAACGVPADLFEPGSAGGQREAFRRFLHAGVSPVARLVAGGLRDALDIRSFDLDLTALHAADVMGRARSWASLVGAGMEPERATEAVGL